MAQKPPHFIWDDHKSDEDDRLGWEGEISRNEKGPGQGRGSDGGEGMEQNFPFLNSHCLPWTPPYFSGLYQYWGRAGLPPGPHRGLWELLPVPRVPHFLLLLYDPEIWGLAGKGTPVSLEESSQHLSAMLWGCLSPQS